MGAFKLAGGGTDFFMAYEDKIREIKESDLNDVWKMILKNEYYLDEILRSAFALNLPQSDTFPEKR